MPPKFCYYWHKNKLYVIFPLSSRSLRIFLTSGHNGSAQRCRPHQAPFGLLPAPVSPLPVSLECLLTSCLPILLLPCLLAKVESWPHSGLPSLICSYPPSPTVDPGVCTTSLYFCCVSCIFSLPPGSECPVFVTYFLPEHCLPPGWA